MGISTDSSPKNSTPTLPLEIFVYGTLKPGESNYARYCEGKIFRAEIAIAPGKLYAFPHLGYPGMVLVERSDAATVQTTVQTTVHGFVLSFANSFANGTVLAELDELEDYDEARSPVHNEYLRQRITVLCGDCSNRPKEVWVYVMTGDRVTQLGGVFLPNGIWTGNAKRGCP